MGQEYDWFWLCSLTELSWKEKARMLAHFGEVSQMRRAEMKEWRKLPFLKEEKLRKLEKAQEKWEAEREYHKYLERGIQFISRVHPDYPEELKRIYDPPFGLFYRGNVALLSQKRIAVVGARMCTPYGKKAAKETASALAQAGVCVVSGMACGIDACAQEAALEAGGTSCAVLGCGPDICYPRENLRLYRKLLERGCVISEYPPGTAPTSWRFPARNRIISGLCRGVVVVEARKKSGTLITADFALEQGREVWAVPGRMGDPLSAGCNRLIAQGAGMLWDIPDFLETLHLGKTGGEEAKKSNLVLAPAEKLVYSCLDSQSKSLQAILDQTDLEAAEGLNALLSLQIQGFAEEIGKNFYAKRK